MKHGFAFLLAAAALLARPCLAGEELVLSAHYANGEVVPYILDSAGPKPDYVIVLFPGGSGRVDPHLEDGTLAYGLRGNFLVRSRRHVVDEHFATATTNSTQSEERVQALLDDLERRFPGARIYLVGTSNGTHSTIALADYLSGRIAGEIHTSSVRRIYDFDPRGLRNRHLIVHHREDHCQATPFQAAEGSHQRFGTELIVMEGGISVGDPCQAFAHHGYNGIERETIDAIKQWIRRGG